MPFLPEIGGVFDAAGDLQLEVKQHLQTPHETVIHRDFRSPVTSADHHDGCAEQEASRLTILRATMLRGLPARMNLRLSRVKQQQTLIGTWYTE